MRMSSWCPPRPAPTLGGRKKTRPSAISVTGPTTISVFVHQGLLVSGAMRILDSTLGLRREGQRLVIQRVLLRGIKLVLLHDRVEHRVLRLRGLPHRLMRQLQRVARVEFGLYLVTLRGDEPARLGVFEPNHRPFSLWMPGGVAHQITRYPNVKASV